MQKDIRKVEILAPAGNMLCLRAAVINGADAVYLGSSFFSARAKAENFSNEELAEAVEYCHLFSVKVYLTVNTILKPSEYEKAKNLIHYAKSVGVDAFIVQDWAFIEYLRITTPDIVVHLSTQSGIHNLEGAITASRLGVSRIVLSRETTLSDLKKITANTSLEVEVFVQGALCVSFSGNCYLSSLASGNSGNRGRCLQFCRKKYRFGNTEGYLLSAKDINSDDILKDIIDAGVTSIKIEGRMRRPEYVAVAVKHYRSLVDGGSGCIEELKRVFNRGDYCSAYAKKPTENVIYHLVQGHIGSRIGNVQKVDGKVAFLSVKGKLNKGDGLKFLRDGKEVGSSLITEKNNPITYLGRVCAGDEVRLTTDSVLNSALMDESREMLVDANIRIERSRLVCTLTANKISARVSNDAILQEAKNIPLSLDDFKRVFEKTGETCFSLGKISYESDGDYFAPKSSLNEFRRLAYGLLSEKILQNYTTALEMEISEKSLSALGCTKLPYCGSGDVGRIIQTDDADKIEKFLSYCDAVAYFPKKYEDYKLLSVFEKYGEKLYLTLPIIARDDDVEVLRNILKSEFVKRVIVNNAYGIELAKGKEILYGAGLNIINPNFSDNCIMSVEYDGKEYGNNFAYAFGKFPVMTFAHCPKKTVNYGKCIKCEQEDGKLFDESGKKFPIRFYKLKYCYSQVLNFVPINLLDKSVSRRIFVDFVGCDDNEINSAISCLCDSATPYLGKYTRGYFNKKLI